MQHYDVAVMGCGPAGERAAIEAAKSGKTVAIMERARVVGGACVNWGTIPSKTLRESAMFVYGLLRRRLEGIPCSISRKITMDDFMYRERCMVQRELALINQGLRAEKITLFQGAAAFVDEHTLSLSTPNEPDRTLHADLIVIATGSSPSRPAEVPFDHDRILDSDAILQLQRLPESLLVIGGGIIGIEYASIFAALGIKVILLDARDRLLPYFDRESIDHLKNELIHLGVQIYQNEQYQRIERVGTKKASKARCVTQSGRSFEADVLLFAVGRNGNTRGIGLETIGVEFNARGLITVNEHLQTCHPHIYAVGDVIGYPALANTSMDQGVRAIRHGLGIDDAAEKPLPLPFALYSIPELSYIGPTEEELQKRGIAYVVGRGFHVNNTRAQILGDTGGQLKLLFEAGSMKLLAAHAVGPASSEIIHLGQAFLCGGVTASTIARLIFNYPTLSDLYRHAAMDALLSPPQPS